MLFRRSEHAFPAHRGYLRADDARVADWRARLAALGPGLKVGLSWRGGSAHTRTKLRSIPLADLAPVLRVPGCRFVSLQYGAVDEDIATLAGETGIELVHFPEAIADYDETAALVSALDLVVTVCTSIVHLTGALGPAGVGARAQRPGVALLLRGGNPPLVPERPADPPAGGRALGAADRGGGAPTRRLHRGRCPVRRSG